MSQRHSEYDRIAHDTYVTPAWCWRALQSVEPWAHDAWDCCPANATFDFLAMETSPTPWIATNPSYGRAAEPIVRHALKLTQPRAGHVAMLLPHAWDTAKGRTDLFQTLPFKTKITLTQRIRWTNLPQKAAGPSTNHAWFVWDWDYMGAPTAQWM
jgi:hypothetical protein